MCDIQLTTFPKKFLWTLVLVLALGLGSCTALRSYTPSIKSPGSIAQLEKVELGGVKQSILIRGRSTSNPILLFLHGGPGMPMMYLSHTFQRELEKDFIVIQWDQRGAGKSYRKNIDPETISDTQYLSDALELIELLKQRFHKQKVFLVGHSWGTYLGSLLASYHPDKLHAYISIGQVVNGQKARQLQREFILTRARWLNRPEAIEDLNQFGSVAHEKWLFKFGGELRADTTWQPFVKAGMRSPEYTLWDALKIRKGSRFCSKHIKKELIQTEIETEITSFDIPCFFLIGTSDMTTPYALVEEYFKRLKAPKKKLILFGRSAHFPFFEEPNKFSRIMREIKIDVLGKDKEPNK